MKKMSNIQHNLENTEEVFLPLQEWLDSNGFTRANFGVIRHHLRDGVDFSVQKDRSIFIHAENTRQRILELDWELLIGDKTENND